MKSTSSVCCAPAMRQSSSAGTQILRGISCCSRSEGRITKPTASTPLSASARICLASATAEPETEVEMLACLAQLQELVPTVSRYQKRSEHSADDDDGQQLSQVQLLQHVIDYIIDLENTLDFRPDVAAFQEAATASVEVLPSHLRVVSRNRMSSYDETAMTSDDDESDRASSDSRLVAPSSEQRMNKGDTASIRSVSRIHFFA
jgi:Helix-loop-helix DNA-binding domain